MNAVVGHIQFWARRLPRLGRGYRGMIGTNRFNAPIRCHGWPGCYCIGKTRTRWATVRRFERIAKAGGIYP